MLEAPSNGNFNYEPRRLEKIKNNIEIENNKIKYSYTVKKEKLFLDTERRFMKM